MERAINEDADIDFDLDAELNKLQALAEEHTEVATNKIGLTKTIGVLVDEWFELKKEIEDIKAEVSGKTTRQNEIEDVLKKLMKDNSIDKVTSKMGSITKNLKCMPSVKDLPTFIRWVSEDIDGRIGFLEKKVSSVAVNEMLEDAVDQKVLMNILSDEDADFSIISTQLHQMNALPPGVDAYMQVKLNKRKK